MYVCMYVSICMYYVCMYVCMYVNHTRIFITYENANFYAVWFEFSVYFSAPDGMIFTWGMGSERCGGT
jgi:hypothetical protein